MANNLDYSTLPGHINRNNQIVIRKTDLPGTDHLQWIYVLECQNCESRYGVNGSDIWQRKCPHCQGGRTGFNLSR